MAQVSYPGVYVEEFSPAPPIQPASTNIAGFVGYATKGPIDKPIKITSFKMFNNVFGDKPVAGGYLWYAVRGFFANGGTICYVVRASNGKPSKWNLKNDNDDNVMTVETLGPDDNVTTQVSVSPSSRIADDLSVFKITAEATVTESRELRCELGHMFRAGDRIMIVDGNEEVTIRNVRPFSSEDPKGNILLDAPLGAPDRDIIISLAPVDSSDTVIRMHYTGTDDLTEKLVLGTVLKIEDEAGTTHGIVDGVDAEFLSNLSVPAESITTYRVALRDPAGVSIARSDPGAVTNVVSQEFDLTVTKSGVPKTYKFLGTDPLHPRYAKDYVNGIDKVVEIEVVDPTPRGGAGQSIPTSAIKPDSGRGKLEEDSAFAVDPQPQLRGLDSLRLVSDVSIVAVPDTCMLSGDDTSNRLVIQTGAIAHCELMADRFAVLDAWSSDLGMFGEGSVEEQRSGVMSARGYAGLYYPWIKVSPARRGPLTSVPPSGHVCGLLARIDGSRGVHKAPAGLEATLNDTVTVTKNMTNDEQGVLNLRGINVIRTFSAGGRPIVFGARTTASDTNWQYVNIRRLFLFLERSIANSLQSSVFEPNNTELWGKLNRVITAFLISQWRGGALFGDTANKAFYVKIDETLNPFEEQQLGKLNIEIGVRPSYPAEFIVVRIGIWDGGMSVSEG